MRRKTDLLELVVLLYYVAKLEYIFGVKCLQYPKWSVNADPIPSMLWCARLFPANGVEKWVHCRVHHVRILNLCTWAYLRTCWSLMSLFCSWKRHSTWNKLEPWSCFADVAYLARSWTQHQKIKRVYWCGGNDEYDAIQKLMLCDRDNRIGLALSGTHFEVRASL